MLAVAPLTMMLAQYASDTIFLTNGKYYICNVIDANEDYVQYGTVAMKSQVLNVAKNENFYDPLPDVIYMKSGKKIACKIISETNNKVYYARNYPSSHVRSLHMGDGEIIYASEFGKLNYTDNLDPSTAESFTSVQNDEPAVISKTVTPTPTTRYEPVQDAPQSTTTTDNSDYYTTSDNEQQYYSKQQDYYDQPTETEHLSQGNDKITLRDGTVIECYIKTFTEDEVTYAEKDYPQLIKSITLDKISTLYYANGQTDEIDN